MIECTVAPVVPVNPDENTVDLLLEQARSNPNNPLFARPEGDAWVDVSAADFLAQVQSIARGLAASGVKPGDRVALMSKTRYEWALCDFAIWYAGAVTVPVYETSSPSQVAWILTDAAAAYVIVETPEHLATVNAVRDQLPLLQGHFVITEGDLDALSKHSAEFPLSDLEARQRALRADDLATIIYTSGTTGNPKGVELTHSNFTSLSRNAYAIFKDDVCIPGGSTVLFMPLAHVFARFVSVLAVTAGNRVAHMGDVKQLLPTLAEIRPNYLLSVPRVFEKVYNSAEQNAEAAGKAKIFAKAVEVAIGYSRAVDAGSIPLVLRLQHAVFDRLVYRKIRNLLGGQNKYSISGGAPLGERLGHFFRGVGAVVLEGYGLTETTAPLCVSVPNAIKVGTVGRPLPGTSVRIADDGEVLARGVQVFKAYHANPEATAEAMQDGWFHTGDLGSLDEDGHLRITGRKKEILVTSAGKNVAPSVLEDRLRAHPLVSQCMVIGDNKPFVAALVTLDPEMLPTWGANHGVEGLTVETAIHNPTVLDALQHAVVDANRAVSRAESIREFRVLDVDFSEANGYLTPTMKLKRNVVASAFEATIEEIYAGPKPGE
ncbi:long-chain fatty acid--CoA ligase [Micrococcales bacterium 31B]|nr:long-chain fatty acid--CoA ligase [Micrococcales bacterium 31B]